MSDYANAASARENSNPRRTTRTEMIYGQVMVMSDTLRASGEFTLRQTDYGIKLVNAARGALKMKGAAKLTFDLTCRKQVG
jgi:hypothetical protein